MAAFVGFINSSQGQLPTHFGHPVVVAFAVLFGCVMKGTAGASFKSGTVQKDAGIVDDLGGPLTVGTGLENGFVGDLCVVLPYIGGEFLCSLEGVCDVFRAREMGSVATATLFQFYCWTVQHSYTSTPENAFPRAAQKREIEKPGSVLMGVFERNPQVGVVGTVHRSRLTP